MEYQIKVMPLHTRQNKRATRGYKPMSQAGFDSMIPVHSPEFWVMTAHKI